MKKLMAFVLVAVMLVGALPFAAFADDVAAPAADTPKTATIVLKLNGSEVSSQTVSFTQEPTSLATLTQYNLVTLTPVEGAEFTHSWSDKASATDINIPIYDNAVVAFAYHKHIPGAAATCSTAQTCSVDGCNEVITPATGVHVWGTGVRTEPKCFQAGKIVYTCTTCTGTNATREETIPATGNHNWSNATCTEPAHCQTEGCQAVNGEERGHSLRETIITPADCDTAGQKRVECAFCTYALTESISALGHDIGSEGKCLRAGCGYTETNRYAVDFYLAYNNITTPTTKLVAAGTKVYDIYIPSRYGYDFAGWYTAAGVRVADNATVNSDSVYYARWTQVAPKEVYVRVYINGNTSNVYAIVDLYEWAQDHVITKADIEAAVAKHGLKAYNKAGLSVYGPFTPAQWNSYCLDDYYRNATERVAVDQNEKTVIYAMVHNVDTYVGSSSSGHKADSSNPKTGDMIFAPMMVLGASASALAALYYISKKRAY